jgi:uncharacterized protein (DUF2252 family)
MAKATRLHSTAEAGGSPAEKKAAAKANRTAVPLAGHAEWAPPSSRPDPVELLMSRDEGRIKHLLPIKYGRMLSSPFTFLRGAAAIMASDLATIPSSRISTQLCGDAHIDNFGVFASPERKLVFDLNDFDETLPGPWEWDLKRLTASAVVAGRELGLSDAICRDAVVAGVSFYGKVMRRLSKLSTLDMWYFHVDVDRLQTAFSASTRRASSSVKRMVSKARKQTHAQSIEKMTAIVDGQRRFKIAPPYLAPLHELSPESSEKEVQVAVRNAWDGYVGSLDIEKQQLLRRFHITDAATRVGGIGSVGTLCAVAILEGSSAGDAVILQQKAAGPSALEAYLGKSRYGTGAERVVHGQRLMQATSDIFLGWHQGPRGSFYWRQLGDMSGSLETADLGKRGFAQYVAACAGCLARAHARAGDAALTAEYIGRTDALSEALGAFALAYADQTERDFETFAQAAASGKIRVESGA